MSVVVKGMKMPENCIECMSSGLRTAIKCTGWTEISAGRRENERAWSCQLVDLGKHGRLVDVTTAYQDTMLYSNRYRESVLKIIDAFTTVIEAEDGT